MKKMMVLAFGVAAGVAAFAGNAFRVTPWQYRHRIEGL